MDHQQQAEETGQSRQTAPPKAAVFMIVFVAFSCLGRAKVDSPSGTMKSLSSIKSTLPEITNSSSSSTGSLLGTNSSMRSIQQDGNRTRLFSKTKVLLSDNMTLSQHHVPTSGNIVPLVSTTPTLLHCRSPSGNDSVLSEKLFIRPNARWKMKSPDGQVWRFRLGNGQREQISWDNPTTARFDEATRNQTTVVLYGSSHLRALYFQLVRLHRGLPYLAKLEKEIEHLACGRILNDNCDPNRTGFLQGLYGINLEYCGEPDKRLIPELGPGSAVGFKTFLHTPDADSRFLDFLDSHDLRHPNILVVDVGVWGARGNRTGLSNSSTQAVMTFEEELDYYLYWLRSSFSSSLIVYVLGIENGPADIVRTRLLAQQANHQNQSFSFVWRKDFLLASKPRNRKFPCGHGCDGPLLDVMGRQLLEFIAAAPLHCNWTRAST